MRLDGGIGFLLVLLPDSLERFLPELADLSLVIISLMA
jgi:hypothetical protein